MEHLAGGHVFPQGGLHRRLRHGHGRFQHRQQLRLVSMEDEATPCWSDAVYVHSAGLRPSAQMQGAQGRVVCTAPYRPLGACPHLATLLCSIVGLSLAVRRCSFTAFVAPCSAGEISEM